MASFIFVHFSHHRTKKWEPPFMVAPSSFFNSIDQCMFRTHFSTKPLVYLPLCFLYKKVPTIPVETHSFNFPTIIKRWCQPFGFHARNLMNSFGCNFLSSSTGFNPCSCFFRLTLAFYFRFWLLWAGHSTFFIVSCPLSYLRCFRFLSSASVLDSDYSACLHILPRTF